MPPPPPQPQQRNPLSPTQLNKSETVEYVNKTGREKALTRVRERIREEERLGIRRRAQKKGKKKREKVFVQAPWNDDTLLGNTQPSQERRMRGRSREEREAAENKRRNDKIRRVMARESAKGKGMGMGMGMGMGKGNAVGNLKVKSNQKYYSGLSRAIATDNIINTAPRGLVDRGDGSPKRSYKSAERTSSMQTVERRTRGTSPFDLSKIEELTGVKQLVGGRENRIPLPNYRQQQQQQYHNHHHHHRHDQQPQQQPQQQQQQQMHQHLYQQQSLQLPPEFNTLTMAIQNLSLMLEKQSKASTRMASFTATAAANAAIAKLNLTGSASEFATTAEITSSATNVSQSLAAATPSTAKNTNQKTNQSPPRENFQMAMNRSMTPGEAEARKTAAILELEMHLNDVETREENLRRRLSAGDRFGGFSTVGRGGRKELGKYEMTNDVKQIYEQLKEHDRNNLPLEEAEKTFSTTNSTLAEAAAKAGNAAVKPGAHIAASSTPQPNSQPQYKPPKKKRAINIDLPKDVIHRLRRQRAAFNRHREITEAALLNSGMRQYQIIELLADDIAVGLVKNIVDELEKGVEGEAERILEIL